MAKKKMEYITKDKTMEFIRVEYKTHDAFDEDMVGSGVDEFIYKISNFNWKFFDVHRGTEKIPDMKLPGGAVLKGNGTALCVTQVPVQDITIKGSEGFDQVTLYFGDFGHIHLSMKTAKAFLEGFEKVYNGMVESRRILKEEGRLIEEHS
ncbi:MAG: hypothetical protein PHH85_03440 [Candidatus Methanoperedens sp.]|nr:hypothetical protein [Candidatus Methanoperedens sp.]